MTDMDEETMLLSGRLLESGIGIPERAKVWMNAIERGILFDGRASFGLVIDQDHKVCKEDYADLDFEISDLGTAFTTAFLLDAWEDRFGITTGCHGKRWVWTLHLHVHPSKKYSREELFSETPNQWNERGIAFLGELRSRVMAIGMENEIRGALKLPLDFRTPLRIERGDEEGWWFLRFNTEKTHFSRGWYLPETPGPNEARFLIWKEVCDGK